MTEKTEALRLADRLDLWGDQGDLLEAAAELRRLHAEVERLSLDGIHSCHAECQRPVCRLTRERDALLEALQALYDEQEGPPLIRRHRQWQAAMDKARAAIAAVEGEST